MKCPRCGTEWKNQATGGEIAAMVVLSVLLFPIGLFSLFLLLNKKYCRSCGYNMKKYVNNKYNGDDVYIIEEKTSDENNVSIEEQNLKLKAELAELKRKKSATDENKKLKSELAKLKSNKNNTKNKIEEEGDQ